MYLFIYLFKLLSVWEHGAEANIRLKGQQIKETRTVKCFIIVNCQIPTTRLYRSTVENVQERDNLEHLRVHWKLILKRCINI